MASSIVSFATDEGEILANLNWLSLATGDTIAFQAPTNGTSPVLFFSPALISILTPTPPQHLVLDSTLSVAYTVVAAQPGAYTILVGSSAEISPYFPERSSTNVFFESAPISVGSPILPPYKSGS